MQMISTFLFEIQADSVVTGFQALLQEASAAGVTITTWDSFLAFGKANPRDATPSAFKDICTLPFSGTALFLIKLSPFFHCLESLFCNLCD
jgi:hypothetical protein